MFSDGPPHARKPLASQSSASGDTSIYYQQIVPEDWFNQWLSMATRVHPFALTWEVERQDGLEESADSRLLA
ncbi:hypothetical protein B0J13DRAFT_573522 [Dactylonectria estremocensis]|uniref:Uncharacterized protein n=1 Tax=Dactylonectria estremocensis TaxID=1079267 RepID=A0A9P9IBA3_9HYPO|nr:hypothetical protein B0J13DRAFT_573522 [Dactylonectria estremocensis]